MMNAIIVMMDTLRPDHLGCYGNRWVKTPNLDAFARESMVFDRAIPEALPTLPVRRSLFTGMRVYPFDKQPVESERGAAGSGTGFMGISKMTIPGCAPIPRDNVTLAEMLRTVEEGMVEDVATHDAFRTALFSDTAPYFSSPWMNYHRGFDCYSWVRGQILDSYCLSHSVAKEDVDRYVPEWFRNDWYAQCLPSYLANTSEWRDEEDHFGPQTFARAIDWLDRGRGMSGPLFLVVDSWDPHEPWDAPQHYVDLYDPGYKGVEMILPFYGSTKLMTEKELHHMRALYAAEVTMMDTWFGKLMNKLGDLRMLEDTLIVVTSDHGHQLGEHGIAGKCPAGMYSELIDCVLMIRHPHGTGAGLRSRALVQHHDIAPTILSFLGVVPPYEMEGQDLLPVMEGTKHKLRDYATCGFAMNVWCHAEEYVLICRTSGEEPQLFDMMNDPLQINNIAWDKPRVVRRMYDLMLADADGGPIAPGYRIPEDFQGARWLNWSPFRNFDAP